VPDSAGKFTACVLTVGGSSELFDHFRQQWERYSSPAIPLRIGINADDGTFHAPPCGEYAPGIVCRDPGNLGKPGMMRRLFHEARIETPWCIWFDDDSYPFRADWMQSLEVAIAAQPHAVMLGITAVTHVCSRMAHFIREAPWYRGVPFAPSEKEDAAARIEFVLGGFWAIKTDWIHSLDWPDRRIVHFEDDYLLGEAIRQHGGKLGRFHSGVKVDTAPRRALSSMPATLDVWKPAGSS
jgi:hypothetical protein